jgi:hypothetical protein
MDLRIKLDKGRQSLLRKKWRQSLLKQREAKPSKKKGRQSLPASIVALFVAAIVGMVAAFFNLKKKAAHDKNIVFLPKRFLWEDLLD